MIKVHRPNVGTVDASPQEELEYQAFVADLKARAVAREAAEAARKDKLQRDLDDVPPSSNSIPAMRDEINKIKAVLRSLVK